MSERGGNRAYLLLGSNIDPESNLPSAVGELARFGRIAAVSAVYESEPVGYAEQANFLNAAVLLETDQTLDALRARVIAEIESRLERVRNPANKNAPRTIDIDLVLFNRDVVSGDDFEIPDPDIIERVFAAAPLAELDADYVHPTANRTLGEIAAELRRASPPLIPRPDIVLEEYVSR